MAKLKLRLENQEWWCSEPIWDLDSMVFLMINGELEEADFYFCFIMSDITIRGGGIIAHFVRTKSGGIYSLPNEDSNINEFSEATPTEIVAWRKRTDS